MSTRRPVSRRLMLALFVLMIVPVCGWYFIGDLASVRLLSALPAASHELVLEIQREIRFKLAITLGISIVVLGGVIAYLRRTVLDPLQRLAIQARGANTRSWSTPSEATRADEVGDLARALDTSYTCLVRRAEEAEHFAANLSHELRTPLAAIRGAGEILADDQLSAANRRRFADNVLSESQRLERLVAGLLALTRAEGEVTEAVAPLPLVPVIEQVLTRCRPLAGSQQQLALAPVAKPPQVRASEDVVIRVLTVLVENAIEHTPADGTIRIGLQPGQDQVVVLVEDSGSGVPAAERERIFDRWYALRSESRQGTGLGLAIARGLIEQLGGDIRVDSSELGGAQFSFTLPRWDDDRPMA